MVVLAIVFVVVGYGEAAQGSEETVGCHADGGCGAEGVSEEGGTAGYGVADAVEELEAGGGFEVEEVHVEA